MNAVTHRKWVRRVWLITVSVLALVVLVIFPSIISFRLRSEIVGLVKPAAAIRLEEFYQRFDEPETLMTEQTIPAGEWQQVLAAFPMSVEAGLGIESFCFEPHHRVVLTTPEHRELAVEICFTCGNISYPGAGPGRVIVPMPSGWRESLLELFEGHGVPVRTEYPSSAPTLEETHGGDR